MHECFVLKTEIQLIQLSINLKLWITLRNLQWGEDPGRTGRQMIGLTEKSSVESNPTWAPCFLSASFVLMCFILDIGSILSRFLFKLLLLDEQGWLILLPLLKETQTYSSMATHVTCFKCDQKISGFIGEACLFGDLNNNIIVINLDLSHQTAVNKEQSIHPKGCLHCTRRFQPHQLNLNQLKPTPAVLPGLTGILSLQRGNNTLG